MFSQTWSAKYHKPLSRRALERQISVLYYERLLSSKEKGVVETEANEKTAPLVEQTKDFLRDPLSR
jgi:predicted nuclease of restriction endonuclease-like (RecB) superfamily